MKSVQEQLEIIRRGTVEIFPEEELNLKLTDSIEKGRPLRVKLGIDPSTKDIHLGHTVVLHKLRQFQDLGHKAVLIIGDGTGLVGDPSGRDKTRPQLTPEVIEENAKTYLEQVYKVISKDNLEIYRNSEWFSKMKFFDLINLASKITVARVLERDDFAERFKNKIPIHLHELIYPVMQGYDSVMVKADVELGGTDQKYNLTVGRDLQRDAGQEPQICITMPLLVGTDGKQKMSKSYGNYIGVTEPAKTIYDKIRSIPDSVIRDYAILLTSIPMNELDKLHISNPVAAKERIAFEIIEKFYSREIAKSVIGSMGETRDVSGKNFEGPGWGDFAQKAEIFSSDVKDGRIWIVKLVSATGFVKSNSEARQKIIEGAVTINGKKVKEPDIEVAVKSGDIIKIGKKRLAVVEIKPVDKFT